MKLHRPIVTRIVDALGSIFFEGRYADRVIEYHFKQNKKWGARDRRFFAETVYDILRWKRRICQQAFAADEPVELMQVWLMVGCYFRQKGQDIRGWSEWSALPESDLSMAEGKFAVQQSYPDGLVELFDKELGEVGREYLVALNSTAPAILRTNTLKCQRAQLQKELRALEIDTEPLKTNDVGLRLAERRNVFTTEPFQKGWFEMQDGASQMVAPFCEVKPGYKVIDACAGAGGKSLHLAAEMKNKGKILSLDIHDWKLKELRQRAKRAGVDIIETRKIETSKVIKRLKGIADVVLLDVPCSGFGVLRRNPDTKWKWSAEKLRELHELQADILSRYSQMVKPGGLLVYATCSVLPSENQQQVEAFLQVHEKGWEFLQSHTQPPNQDGYDGFFIAKMKKL